MSIDFSLPLYAFVIFGYLFFMSCCSSCCSWSKSIDSINSLYTFVCLVINSCLLNCNLIGLFIWRLSMSLCSLVFVQFVCNYLKTVVTYFFLGPNILLSNPFSNIFSPQNSNFVPIDNNRWKLYFMFYRPFIFVWPFAD